MHNAHILELKMLIFVSLQHRSSAKSEQSCRLISYLHFRKEKWLQIKLVPPSFAFVLPQPQEYLSSHAADDQGQAHVCTLLHISVLVLQMKPLSIFSHPTQSYLIPPPHLSSACDAVTSFLASADAVYPRQKKKFLKILGGLQFTVHATRSVFIQHTRSERFQDFTAAADGGESDKSGKNKTIFQVCAMCCAHKERFYLKLFMTVAAIPIIVFLLLCNVALMIKIEVKQLSKIEVTC